MAKVTPRKKSERETVVVRTKEKGISAGATLKWWKAKTQDERSSQVLASAAFLKEQQQFRYRQAGIYARLYGNMPLYNWIGTNMSRLSSTNQLPADRPTMNVVQSCIDTLVSRLTQAKPRPVFLTDNGDYKQRNLAKKLNNFILGEFYQTQAYQMGELMLRDAAVLGTSCLKIYKTLDKKVGIDRVIQTELLVDPNDGLYGKPRQLLQLQLVDREVLYENFPGESAKVATAQQSFPDTSSDSSGTLSDQVMLVEAWHLPSGPDADDGKHLITSTSGLLLEEDWKRDKFPFVFLHYSPRILGFWAQSLAEQLMGTQSEINKLLMTISQAINLVGVPRVFVQDGSKVVKSHLNNQIGAIVTYQGTKPEYEVAPCIPGEVYAQLQRLIDYAYQQSGVSALAAASKKPEGLDSGRAIREYDDLQSDRFASLNKRYDQMYIELAHQVMDQAREIAEEEGSYTTVYPAKDGTKEVPLPETKNMDPYVIQTFDASSLPKDPAGRRQTIVEMIQSGMINIQEGRRLLDYPDLDQVNVLANASEERTLKYLDMIVESGTYTPPDAFMDLAKAEELAIQYYNLYIAAKLDAKKAQQLRDFLSQVKMLMAAAQPPAPMGAMPGAGPQAVPEALPTSDMLPMQA